MSEQKLTVPPRSVFAAVLLRATETPRPDKGPNWPSLVDLTNMIVDLKRRHHLDTSEISIRADKGGWISDDLSSFVDGFVLFGLATQKPIALAPEARRECEEILSEDSQRDPEAIMQLLRVVGLPSVRVPDVATAQTTTSAV